ncbi:MAG: hypothetical protein WBA23_03315, partial [Tunicatimonas sp.]|uniref:hypothetical protein n=1 Tax=Tunicatimonas sp. TaxID=1940096 RepID=UPI003C72B8C1
MSIEKLIRRSEKAINGVLNNSSWQKIMNPLGFTAAELQQGKKLGADLQTLAVLQKKEYGEQYNATDALNKAKEKAWKVYKHHLQIARVAVVEDRGKYRALQLNGVRERNLLKWVKQARTFYTNAKIVASEL